MRRTPIYETTTPEGVTHPSETARPEMPRAGTLIARAAAHDRISAALRKARKRASLSEQQVVDLMRARGVSITTATLERWEQHGRHPARGGGRPGRRVPHDDRRARGTAHPPGPPVRLDGARPAALRLGVSHNGRVLLAELVTTSAAVAATRSRLAKVAALADCLRRAEPGEIAIVVSYLSGELRQRRSGVGWAALRDLPAARGRAQPGGRRGRPRLCAHRGGERPRLGRRPRAGARSAVRARHRRGAALPRHAGRRRAAPGRARRHRHRRRRGGRRGRAGRGAHGRRCWPATCRPSPRRR